MTSKIKALLTPNDLEVKCLGVKGLRITDKSHMPEGIFDLHFDLGFMMSFC